MASAEAEVLVLVEVVVRRVDVRVLDELFKEECLTVDELVATDDVRVREDVVVATDEVRRAELGLFELEDVAADEGELDGGRTELIWDEV